MLVSHMTRTRGIRENMYVKRKQSWNISGEYNKESIGICNRSEFKAELDFKISDVTVRELLNFIYGAGSVVFNWN